MESFWPKREEFVKGLKEKLEVHKNNKHFYEGAEMLEHALIEAGYIRHIEEVIKELEGEENESSFNE